MENLTERVKTMTNDKGRAFIQNDYADATAMRIYSEPNNNWFLVLYARPNRPLYAVALPFAHTDCSPAAYGDLAHFQAQMERKKQLRMERASPEMFALLQELLTEMEQGWEGDEPRELSEFESRVQRVVTQIDPHRYDPGPDSQADYSQLTF